MDDKKHSALPPSSFPMENDDDDDGSEGGPGRCVASSPHSSKGIIIGSGNGGGVGGGGEVFSISPAALVAPEVELGHFECNGIHVICGPMTRDDYPAVMKLLPGVSRCKTSHVPEEVSKLLSAPTYHPWCAYRLDTGELVGFAEIHRLPHLGRNYDARLERVIVSPDFRRQGLATKFVRHIIQQARDKLDCGRIDLTVEKAEAQTLYCNLGFAPVATNVYRLEFQPQQP